MLQSLKQMEAWQLEIGYAVARYFWLALSALALLVLDTVRQRIRNRCLGEVLERNARVSLSRESALSERITDRLLKAFFKAPKPTLESLANDTETPWNLTPSTGSFPKREK